MSDMTAAGQPSTRFQFTVGDLFFALVTLAFPIALIAMTDREVLPDSERNLLWILILLTGVVGFVISLSLRITWRSQSPFVVPSFLVCIWCCVLLFYITDIPEELMYPMLVYPSLFAGIVTVVHWKKSQLDNSYIAGCCALGLAAAMTYMLTLHVTRSRMGQRETMAAATCKAIAEAQENFHRVDHDKDGKREYSPDLWGLYESKPNTADLKLISLALARADFSHPSPRPYRGYFYRILHAQGELSPGGAKTWMDDKGNLILAHGAVAYPSEYNVTGRNSFVISSTGTIFQKDYGPDTPRIAKDMVFNPDTNWGCCE